MFNKEDFSKIKNNPFAVKSGQKMWQAYPELRNYKWLSSIPADAFLKDTGLTPEANDLDTMIKFVVLLVERHNNPISTIKNFDKRIDAVWEILEVKPLARIKIFVDENHFWFHEVLFEYFCYCNDDQYELWFSLKMSYRNNMKYLRTPPGLDAKDSDITNRNKISKESEGLMKQIQEWEFRLFGDERMLEIINSMATKTNRYAEKYAVEYNPPELPHFD